jgi:signal transduction histidine kinase
MGSELVDPRWSKLLSLTVHEFRTPLSVVAGYLRMLLKERAGPLSEQQKHLVEEAEKSCARLSALVAEVSELSGLEGETPAFTSSPVDLRAIVQEAIEALPALPDRIVSVELRMDGDAPRVRGDAPRLRKAVAAVIAALRREVVTTDRLVVAGRAAGSGMEASAILAIADPERIEALASADPSALTTFDEWRGGVGLSLAIARRVLNAHGARSWSPVEGTRGGAVIAFPVV